MHALEHDVLDDTIVAIVQQGMSFGEIERAVIDQLPEYQKAPAEVRLAVWRLIDQHKLSLGKALAVYPNRDYGIPAYMG